MNKQPGKPDHPHPLTPQYYLAEMALPEDTEVLVSQQDFDQAFNDLVPSVSQSEMDHYGSIQRRFSRTKPNDADIVNSSHSQIQAVTQAEDVRYNKGKGKAAE